MTALPTRMTAIGIKAPGGPEMLVPEQRPVPTPGQAEILVKVAAAGVNRPDVMQRQGLYPPPAGAPDIPGLEIAGEVVALGPNVKRWKTGDRVMALVVGGGYAEYCITHESHALPVNGLSMVEAAAVPETFFTVWHNMVERGGLKSGESFLVHGGSSGIGTTAIQLAKALGARVITTAGTTEKCAASLLTTPAALAVESVNVRLDAAAVDLTAATDVQKTDGDRIQVSTAPGPDGIVRRIEVRAREANTNWAVFALTNNSDEQIDRLIVVPHYRMVGSGLFWPDLGLSRIASITPSSGDRPLRQENTTADIFRVTLDPGTVITFVAELRTDKLSQIYLWEPDAYKDKVNSFTLYYGIVIGIAGLLALFLTILFVVKGSVMFPAAAALGWAVLIYIGIDFGFWGKVFDMSAGAERVWRACGEAILSATLLVFLFAYLNLSRWHVRYAHITIAWLAALAALIAVAVFDPAVAAGIARISLAMIAVFGLALVIYLSTHGFDRAVLLIPTWLLLVVWTLGAGFAVTGVVTNDIIGPALLGGLVLIVMLIGFTVMQHAFAGGLTHGIVSDVERRALALTGAGDLIWDWDVSADKVYTSPETEQLLGLKRGTLEGPAADWLEVLHPLDRDRFRASLDSAVEQRRGRLSQTFRLRAANGHYLWFSLKARPVVGSDGEVVRLSAHSPT